MDKWQQFTNEQRVVAAANQIFGRKHARKKYLKQGEKANRDCRIGLEGFSQNAIVKKTMVRARVATQSRLG